MRHKWNILTDTCENCGCTKSVARNIRKDGMRLSGFYYTYTLNGVSTSKAPECVLKENKILQDDLQRNNETR